MTFAMLAACASAAGEHKVAGSRIESGPWAFHGIYSDTNTFDNIVAIAKPGSVQQGNIVAVWYSKSGASWSAKSWVTEDPREAVKSVKAALSIPDSQDEQWLTPPVGVAVAPETPKGYKSGVLEADPMLAVVQSAPDPELVVQVLVSSGYKAAAIDVDKDDACGVDAKMDQLSTEFARMFAGGDDAVLTVSSLANFCGAVAGPPIGPEPTKPTKPGTAPGWSPPGTVPTAPGWTPGGWPTNPGPPVTNKWWCFATAGGASCFCSRQQRWGAWETTTCGFIITWSCIRWHEIIQTESCNMNLAPSCPPGGPPPAGATCDSTY